MITNQKKHEMQWHVPSIFCTLLKTLTNSQYRYSGRQDLKQMQARRAAGANEIQNILLVHPSCLLYITPD